MTPHNEVLCLDHLYTCQVLSVVTSTYTFPFLSSSFSSNVGNCVHVTIFGSEKHSGLADIGYMELEGDTARGKKGEASSTESLPSTRIFPWCQYRFLITTEIVTTSQQF